MVPQQRAKGELMSQSKEILNALQKGERITPLDALRRFGCFRLSGRIKDLKDRGYDIKTAMVTDGYGKRFAEYYLPPSTTNVK